MNHAEYQQIVRQAHDVRILARNLASYQPLEDAIQRARTTAHGRRAGHEQLLLAVRDLAVAANSTKTLAGAVAAREPADDRGRRLSGSFTDPSAPAPAKNVSMGAGSAPEPEPALRAGGSSRGSHASAPVETVASDPGALRLRMGPAASGGPA